MEAITVVSLVSNGLQIVDFCARLVSKTSEIQKHGTPATDSEIESAIADLERMRASIQLPVSGDTPALGPITEAEHENLISKSSSVSKDILAFLRKVKLSPDASTLKSIRKAMKCVLGREKLENLCSRLSRLQAALQLHCIFNLKANGEIQSLLQDERHRETLTKYDKVLHLILRSEEKSRTLSLRQTRALLHQQAEADRVSRDQFVQTMAAIEQLPGRIRLKQTTAALEHHCQSEPAHASRLSYVSGVQLDPPPHLATLARKRVLDGLRFRQMKVREFEIDPAHCNTFRWVLSGTKSQSWDDLATWLANGTGCYWVNGKAASGKSTLMKFVARHDRTEAALRRWAGSNYLLILSFFFWNSSGIHLQRSQEGLYRSILYEVLSQHEALIPEVFPELYAEELGQRQQSTQVQPLSKAELKLAFMRLLTSLPTTARVCLFIDGLDEYEGQHEDICELFRSIVHKPNLKVVLSSRPIPACLEAFKNCRGMRLEDLTKDDIRQYVFTKLGEQPRMRELEVSHPEDAKRLMENIVSRASGVFLWVMLVVKSLTAGLRDYDRVSDLQRRLDDIPRELEAMYKHMLSNMKPFYQSQASQLFQILLLHTELGLENPLTLLELSFAEEDDPETSIKLSDKGLNSIQIQSRVHGTYKRLISRCCGLLEIFGPVSPSAHVNFLHKTVADFLREPGIRDYLHQLTQGSGFDGNVSLVSSSLAILKLSRQDWQWQETVVLAQDRQLQPILSHVKTFFQYCAVSEGRSGSNNITFVRECDRVMSRGWSHVVLVEKIKPCLRNHAHWAVVMSLAYPDYRYYFVDSLVGLAAVHNLGLFIGAHVGDDVTCQSESGVLPQLLMQTIQTTYRDNDLSQAKSCCEVVQSLMARRLVVACDDELLNRGWELAVYYFDQAANIDDDALFPDWQVMATRMAFCLLKSGADPNIRVRGRVYSPYSGQPLVDERSALCIVEEALEVYQSRRGIGVQQLIATVAALRDLLVVSGAESSTWLDGRLVSKVPAIDVSYVQPPQFIPTRLPRKQNNLHTERKDVDESTAQDISLSESKLFGLGDLFGAPKCTDDVVGAQTTDTHSLLWVYVESSAEGTFLAGCAACSAGKRYTSEKNAIFHLRLAHFNSARKKKMPKTRGKKAIAQSSRELESKLSDRELAKWVRCVPSSDWNANPDSKATRPRSKPNPRPPCTLPRPYLSDDVDEGGFLSHREATSLYNPTTWSPKDDGREGPVPRTFQSLGLLGSMFDTFERDIAGPARCFRARRPVIARRDGRRDGIKCVHDYLRRYCPWGCGFVFEPSAR